MPVATETHMSCITFGCIHILKYFLYILSILYLVSETNLFFFFSNQKLVNDRDTNNNVSHKDIFITLKQIIEHIHSYKYKSE